MYDTWYNQRLTNKISQESATIICTKNKLSDCDCTI